MKSGTLTLPALKIKWSVLTREAFFSIIQNFHFPMSSKGFWSYCMALDALIWPKSRYQSAPILVESGLPPRNSMTSDLTERKMRRAFFGAVEPACRELLLHDPDACSRSGIRVPGLKTDVPIGITYHQARTFRTNNDTINGCMMLFRQWTISEDYIALHPARMSCIPTQRHVSKGRVRSALVSPAYRTPSSGSFPLLCTEGLSGVFLDRPVSLAGAQPPSLPLFPL